jgi:hypothetical protein
MSDPNSPRETRAAAEQSIAIRRWWKTRAAMMVFIALAVVPLLWPAIPPLSDLPGHIGRYRIMAEAGRPPLSEHYAVHWALIGNLGVDGLVLALAPLLGIEVATKIVVMLIPLLSVAAMLWLAREVHGRVPATAGFALPLAYASPFQLGFVNFALASALVLAALALWLRLARRGTSPWVRALVFVPISCLIFVCHSFGWAMLGLFVFGAEWAIGRKAGRSAIGAGFRAALMCAPMALPLILLVLGGPDHLAGGTGDWFDIRLKLFWIGSLLRERWQVHDVVSAMLLYAVIALALRSRRLSLAPVLAVPALLGAVAFVLLPAFYAGGSMVDMRLLPMTVALALLAINAGGDRLEQRIAVLAATFFAVRMATTTVAFVLFAQGQTAALRAIDAIPQGASVLTLVNEPAADNWTNPRLGHIAGLAIARRRIFTNEQWALAGQQLVRPLHPSAAPFDRDPSQLIYPATVPGSMSLQQAIATFDRRTFGYVWTVGFPTGAACATDLQVIWSNARSTIYRVTPSPQAKSAAPCTVATPAASSG